MRKILHATIILIVYLTIFLTIGLQPAYAQIDPVVAKIKLTKLEIITQSQLKEKVDILEEEMGVLNTEYRRQVLEAMIDEKVLLQAGERENISVPDSELTERYEMYKLEIANQLGLQYISDEQFKEMLEEYGLTVEELKEQLIKQGVMEKLVMEIKGESVMNVPLPTEEEIEEYYDANKTQYPIVSPDIINFKQIMVNLAGLTSDEKEKARTKIDNIYNQLKAGSSFDVFQEVYLEDSYKLIGTLNYSTWFRSDPALVQYYGVNFINKVFKLGKGEMSGVLESSLGYHIVEIIDKIPFQILGLDDKIPPQYNITIREYISSGLYQQKQMIAFQEAAQDLVMELRSESDIEVIDQYLIW
jgi:peptidyl-prolyl cis-trans isomerase SurA